MTIDENKRQTDFLGFLAPGHADLTQSSSQRASQCVRLLDVLCKGQSRTGPPEVRNEGSRTAALIEHDFLNVRKYSSLARFYKVRGRGGTLVNLSCYVWQKEATISKQFSPAPIYVLQIESILKLTRRSSVRLTRYESIPILLPSVPEKVVACFAEFDTRRQAKPDLCCKCFESCC